jgi:hypothetical protein
MIKGEGNFERFLLLFKANGAFSHPNSACIFRITLHFEKIIFFWPINVSSNAQPRGKCIGNLYKDQTKVVFDNQSKTATLCSEF